MHKNLNINIHEITRVEGHGNIVIDVKKRRVKEFKLEIIESPRFFEAMLRGRKFDEAQHIMSRICGICAVSHTSASLKAIEEAMGIKISRQAGLLRRLAFCGETIQSHVLHLHFLVLPDMVGVGSIVPLMKTHPDIARAGLEIKALANDICAVVAGRHIHPISLFPGGVVHTPKPAELRRLRSDLEKSFDGLERTLDFFADHSWPEYSRPRDFISLKARGEYGIYDGSPYTSKKYSLKTSSYTKKVKEYIVSHSTAKHAISPRGTIMVGSLSRLNNNYKQLLPRARAAARRLNISPTTNNPFMNNSAQLVECFHCTEEAIRLIDKLLSMGPRPEPIKKPRKFGRGIGIVEAPRGTLYHEYTINRDGCIEDATCIIPTAQNLRSIEEDLQGYVPMLLDRPKQEIRSSVETLVRAYDPCISCSTHIMNVEFV